MRCARGGTSYASGSLVRHHMRSGPRPSPRRPSIQEVVRVTIAFDPFRQMDRLTRELLGQGTQGRGMSWMPMDVYREGDHLVANIDLPGVDPGSIDVDVEGNTVTVRAQRSVRGEDT